MKELYEAALQSVKKYKENEEELTDFDTFMDEMENEYGMKKGQI